MLTLQLCCFVSINFRYTFKYNWLLDWDLQCTRRKSESVFCVWGGLAKNVVRASLICIFCQVIIGMKMQTWFPRIFISAFNDFF